MALLTFPAKILGVILIIVLMAIASLLFFMTVVSVRRKNNKAPKTERSVIDTDS